MPYITCSICGRGSSQALDIDICARCLNLSNDKIKILAIKKYLEKNPDAKVDEVCRELNIKREKINQFIDEGSLRLIYDKDIIADSFKKVEEDESKKTKRRMLISELANMSNYKSSGGKTQINRNCHSGGSKLVQDLEKLKRDREGR